jgi:hypothetical protein
MIEVNLDVVECEACGRALLRGEHAKQFLDLDMMPRRVCDLCPDRAARAGWLPEEAQQFAPVPQQEGRRGLVSRLLRRRAAAAGAGG